jgi:predicted peptidase
VWRIWCGVTRLPAIGFFQTNLKLMHTRILPSILLATVCLRVGLQAQDKPQDKSLTPHSFEHRITVRADYLLFLPKGYEANSDKRWPLILFLHGAGERGTNVWQVDIHGPAKYIAEHPEFPFILVSPQCPAGEAWSNEVVLELLNEVSASHKVDSQRVYLTGLSMGGFGTWDLAVMHPEKFAAVAPICGGGEVLHVLLAKLGYATPERKAALKGLPVWAFHGARDNIVPPTESERMVRALKDLGAGEVKLTVYPEATHNSWAQTYSNPEFYQWLLEHKRER